MKGPYCVMKIMATWMNMDELLGANYCQKQKDENGVLVEDCLFFMEAFWHSLLLPLSS